MQRFSKKWIYKALRDAHKKLEESDIDDTVKKLAGLYQPIISINPYLRTTAGQVYIMVKGYHNCSKIPQKYKNQLHLIDGKLSYVILELSAHHIFWDSAAEVKNTTIH